MSEMVERVAKTILEALEREDVYAKAVDGDLGACIVDGGTFDMRAIAMAAVEEMREPTEGMQRAAFQVPVTFKTTDGAYLEGHLHIESSLAPRQRGGISVARHDRRSPYLTTLSV